MTQINIVLGIRHFKSAKQIKRTSDLNQVNSQFRSFTNHPCIIKASQLCACMQVSVSMYACTHSCISVHVCMFMYGYVMCIYACIYHVSDKMPIFNTFQNHSIVKCGGLLSSICYFSNTTVAQCNTSGNSQIVEQLNSRPILSS